MTVLLLSTPPFLSSVQHIYIIYTHIHHVQINDILYVCLAPIYTIDNTSRYASYAMQFVPPSILRTIVQLNNVQEYIIETLYSSVLKRRSEIRTMSFPSAFTIFSRSNVLPEKNNFLKLPRGHVVNMPEN